MKLSSLISQKNLIEILCFHRFHNSKYDIEIGRSKSLVLLLYFWVLFKQNWNFIVDKMLFRKSSQIIYLQQNFSVRIIKTNHSVDRFVLKFVRIAIENSEIRVFNLVGFFGLQRSVINVHFEFVKVEDVSNFDIESVILSSITPKIDLSGFLGTVAIYNFQLLDIVSIRLVFVNIGTINDNTNGAIETIICLLC